MKKFIFIVFSCLFMGAFAFGVSASTDIDLSGMSYDELVALKDRINLAIWESDEWQEVSVPQGIYKVGEDIPSGKWTILAPDEGTCYIMWGEEPDKTGTSLEKIDGYEIICSPTNQFYEKNTDRTQIDIELIDGMYFHVKSGIAVFTTYAGKISLGFK